MVIHPETGAVYLNSVIYADFQYTLQSSEVGLGFLGTEGAGVCEMPDAGTCDPNY